MSSEATERLKVAFRFPFASARMKVLLGFRLLIAAICMLSLLEEFLTSTAHIAVEGKQLERNMVPVMAMKGRRRRDWSRRRISSNINVQREESVAHAH